MSAEAHQEILRTEGLSKFFPGVKALDNVNFSLRRGEIMALLGENGAGKSTLIKALTGVYHADRGTIWLEGQAISPKNTAHAQQLGIGTVYQEVNLLPNMSVADNLFIGREPRRFVLWSSFFGHADQMVGLCTGGQLGGRAGQRFVLCG